MAEGEVDNLTVSFEGDSAPLDATVAAVIKRCENLQQRVKQLNLQLGQVQQPSQMDAATKASHDLLRNAEQRLRIEMEIRRQLMGQTQAQTQANVLQSRMQTQAHVETQRQAQTSLFSRGGIRAIMRRLGGTAEAAGVSSEFASLPGSMARFGTAAGIALLGVMALTKGVGHVVEQHKLLKQETKEYHRNINEIAASWANMARSQIATTDIGRQFRDNAESARQKILALRKELDAINKNPGLFQTAGEHYLPTNIGELFFPDETLPDPTTARGRRAILKQNEIMYQKWIMEKQEEEAKRQEPIQRERVAAEQRSELDLARLRNQPSSLLNRKRILYQEGREAERKIDAEFDSKWDKFTSDSNIAIAVLESKVAADKKQHGGIKDVETAMELKKRKQELEEGQKNIQDEYHRAIFHSRDMEKEKLVALEKQYAREMAAIHAQVGEEEIKQGERGWNERLKLLQHAARERVRIAKETGQDVKKVELANAMREHTFRIERDEEVADRMLEMNQRIRVAQSPGESLPVLLEQAAKAAKEQWGLAGKELEKYLALFKKAAQADADAALNSQTKALQIELKLVNMELSEQAAHYQKLLLANPKATQQALNEASWATTELRARQFTLQETAFLHPERALKKYVEQVREAMAVGGLGIDEAQILLGRKYNELYNSGQFSDKFVKGQVDFRALALARPEDAAAVQREGNNLLVEIRDRLGQILEKETLN